MAKKKQTTPQVMETSGKGSMTAVTAQDADPDRLNVDQGAAAIQALSDSDDGHDLLGEADPELGGPARDSEPAEDESEGDEMEDLLEELTEDAEEDEFEDADPDEDAEAPTYKVKVQGEEIEVTLDELRLGYSREADYRKKTTELGQKRREVEQIRERATQAEKRYADKLAGLEASLDNLGPDTRNYIESEAARVREAAALRQAEQYQERLQAAQANLPEVIPEWRDAEAMQRELPAIKDYALNAGLAEETLAMVDEYSMAILRKAMKYDELTTKGRDAIREKAKGPSKTLQPGSRNGSGKKKGGEYERAMKRLSQTGTPLDAAAAIEGLFGDDL